MLNVYGYIQPDLEMNRYIQRHTCSDFRYCFTCRSCTIECPVNIFTGRLNPVRLVRLASFGLRDELIRSREIWYCLGCGRCSNICPMNVKPHRLISSMRCEAINEGLISPDIGRNIFELFVQFHRRRLQVVHMCINGEEVDQDSLEVWDSYGYIPKQQMEGAVPFVLGNVQARRSFSDFKGIPTEISLCLTCRECSNTCPVGLETDVFDPLFFIRAVALGLRDEVLSIPSMWLCIECETCSNTCAQGVKGHLIMKRLKELAIETSVLEKGFLHKWNGYQKQLFDVLLNKVDLVLERFRL